MSGSRPVYEEAQASTEMNHPTVTFTGTPIPGK